MRLTNETVLVAAIVVLGCSPASVRTDAVSGGGATGSGGASVAPSNSGAAAGNGPGGGLPGADPDSERVSDPGGTTCGTKTFSLGKAPPDLLIVLDKSGSMNEPPDGSTANTKWTQMTTAINQVVSQTDAFVRWGIKLFPEDSQCGVGMNVAAPIADRNGAVITSLLSRVSANGGTPTRVALAGATMYLASLPDPNPKFILLATDGMPNCAPGQTGGSTSTTTINGVTTTTSTGSPADDSQATVQAVADANKNGIPVFVIGIGNVAQAQSTLTAMAVAGGRPQAAAPSYYPVSSTAELAGVLSNIGTTLGACSFGLGTAPPDPTNIRVTGNGMKIPHDPGHANGWDYGTGKTSIQLFGQYCEKAKAGTLKDVQALFGCPGVVVN